MTLCDGQLKSDIGSSPDISDVKREQSEKKAELGGIKRRRSYGDCPYCSKKMNSNLKRHINLVHLKIGFVTCQFCSRKFGQSRGVDFINVLRSAFTREYPDIAKGLTI